MKRGSELRRAVLVAHPSADLYGSDRVMVETVTALVDAGRRVTVTVPADGPLVPELRSRGAEVTVVPTVVLRRSMLSPRGLVRAAVESVRAVRGGLGVLGRVRPDVVVVNTVTVPLWLVLARVRRVPVVCHVHEAEASVARWKQVLLASPLRLAHVVVANSRQTVTVMRRSAPSVAARAVVVHNPVTGPEAPSPARTPLDPPARLIYVGRLSPRKGVDVVVDAAALLAGRGLPVHVDVVGSVFPGYEWYETQLRAQVDRLGLAGRVALHGFRPDVRQLLSGADIAVVPSRTDESFGNTAVEALLAARPVVVSSIDGLLEATGGYEAARAVPPGDPVALADAVEQMVGEWDVLAKAATEDRGLAAQRHDPAVYRATMVRLVSEAAAR